MPNYAEQIAGLTETLAQDEEKFIHGNYAAGTRVRKTLQQIKKICTDGRKEVQASKKAEAESE